MLPFFALHFCKGKLLFEERKCRTRLPNGGAISTKELLPRGIAALLFSFPYGIFQKPLP